MVEIEKSIALPEKRSERQGWAFQSQEERYLAKQTGNVRGGKKKKRICHKRHLKTKFQGRGRQLYQLTC